MERPRQLPSGNWQQRFTGPDGKRHSVVEPTARKAQKAGAVALAELERKAASNEPEKIRTRFETFAEEWLYTRRPGEPDGYAISSYPKRQHHLKELNRTFGDQMIEEITPAMVRAWWNTKASTPHQRHTLFWFLHAIFEVALDDELIHRNPCRVPGASKAPGKKRPTFSDADVDSIYTAADHPQMKAIILILMGTALRIGELVALDWEDIRFLTKRLHVSRHWTPYGIVDGTKTGADKTRTVHLAEWVLEALEDLYASSDGEGAIFRNSRGGRLTVDGAETRFRKIRERAGLRTMHLHDVRHAALTAYGRLPGITLKEIMEFGGHESERTAMGYQHASEERAETFAASLPHPLKVKR